MNWNTEGINLGLTVAIVFRCYFVHLKNEGNSHIMHRYSPPGVRTTTRLV
jgi:hypothetical protein